MREIPLLKTDYHGSYYIANIIQNILSDKWDYLRLMDDFYETIGEDSLCLAFSQDNILKKFIQFILGYEAREELSEIFPEDYNPRKQHFKKTPVELWLKQYEIEHLTARQWLQEAKGGTEDECFVDRMNDYYDELWLTGPMEELFRRRSEEIFFILFQNRTICAQLIACVSGRVQQMKKNEYPEALRVDGILKRKILPEWAKRAIFFRDRGKCVECGKDLTESYSAFCEPEYDHIVPLKLGGINDIVNIQLMCKQCNRAKTGDTIFASHKYEKWY